MKKLALERPPRRRVSLFTAPAFAFDGTAAPGMRLAQADVKVKGGVKTDGDRRVVKKKVVIRHGDRGLHRGWTHSRHYGAMKTKSGFKKSGHGTTVIKKKITHG